MEHPVASARANDVALEEHTRRRARSVAAQLRNVDFRGFELDEVADTLVRIEQRLDAVAARVAGRGLPP